MKLVEEVARFPLDRLRASGAPQLDLGSPQHPAAGRPAIRRRVEARRISPTDTNYFALLFDPHADHIAPVCVVEIFSVGGATPPNMHRDAHEFFLCTGG